MPYQNIDASLSAGDIQAIKDAFAAVVSKLPFLVNLTVDERRQTFKAGPDSLSFVTNTLSAAQNHPTALPPSFDTPAFQRDVDLFAVMTEFATLADSIRSRIDDTRLAVGGEAMQEAIQAYGYLKVAQKTIPGLKPVVEQLAERFKKAGKQKAEAKPNP